MRLFFLCIAGAFAYLATMIILIALSVRYPLAWFGFVALAIVAIVIFVVTTPDHHV